MLAIQGKIIVARLTKATAIVIRPFIVVVRKQAKNFRLRK